MHGEDLLEWAMEAMPESSSDSSGIYDNFDSDSMDKEAERDEIGNAAEHDILFPMMQLLMHSRRRQRVNNYLDTVHGYSNDEFKEHFRLSCETAYCLIGSLSDSGFIPSQEAGPAKVSAEWSFLITVWYLANTEPLRTVADRFDVGITTVWRILRRVVDWLLSQVNDVVVWPTGQAVAEVSNAFMQKQGIRKCIGAIDGSHIPIRAPPNFQRDYVNRKKFHSIILQAVVTADLKFTNLYCGEPGSVHDARVWRRSELFLAAQRNPNALFPDETFLLGDSAYPSMPFLVPPFRDNGHLTPQQAEFNFLHSSTRMAVEKAFGVLKSRFRRLRGFELLNVEDVVNTTLAACVLHNYCIMLNDVDLPNLDPVVPDEVGNDPLE